VQSWWGIPVDLLDYKLRRAPAARAAAGDIAPKMIDYSSVNS
jgi:hypothetical protein